MTVTWLFESAGFRIGLGLCGGFAMERNWAAHVLSMYGLVRFQCRACGVNWAACVFLEKTVVSSLFMKVGVNLLGRSSWAAHCFHMGGAGWV